jgi:hypothetical protein
MMDKLKDILSDLGDTSSRYARDVSCRTRALSRRVGPKRGGIALGLLAAAIGTRFLVRFLKNRSQRIESEEQEADIARDVRGRRARGYTATTETVRTY